MKRKNILPPFALATALVTPFRGGSIDFSSLDGIIERQLEARVPALVVCGTTGEPCSLSDDERDSLIVEVLRRVDGRALTIAGTGSNDTSRAVALTSRAASLGCDGALVVTPYYNKATNEGLVAHYRALSDGADIPLIVYNVPSRTGMDIAEGMYKALSEIKNVAAVKEATQSFSGLLRALDECGDEISLYCGNDSYTLASIACGACGVISVASNLVPEAMMSLVTASLSGDMESARETDRSLHGLFNALSCDVNPSPIKYAMSLFGLCGAEVRLPLTVPDGAKRERIARECRRLRHS